MDHSKWGDHMAASLSLMLTDLSADWLAGRYFFPPWNGYSFSLSFQRLERRDSTSSNSPPPPPQLLPRRNFPVKFQRMEARNRTGGNNPTLCCNRFSPSYNIWQNQIMWIGFTIWVTFSVRTAGWVLHDTLLSNIMSAGNDCGVRCPTEQK